MYNAIKAVMLTLFVMTYSQISRAEMLSHSETAIVGKNTASININGEDVAFINIAFADYIANVGNYYRDILINIKYYRFTITHNDDLVRVKVMLNNDLIKKDKDLVFQGGGAEYLFKGGALKIHDITRYK